MHGIVVQYQCQRNIGIRAFGQHRQQLIAPRICEASGTPFLSLQLIEGQAYMAKPVGETTGLGNARKIGVDQLLSNGDRIARRHWQWAPLQELILSRPANLIGVFALSDFSDCAAERRRATGGAA